LIFFFGFLFFLFLSLALWVSPHSIPIFHIFHLSFFTRKSCLHESIRWKKDCCSNLPPPTSPFMCYDWIIWLCKSIFIPHMSKSLSHFSTWFLLIVLFMMLICSNFNLLFFNYFIEKCIKWWKIILYIIVLNIHVFIFMVLNLYVFILREFWLSSIFHLWRIDEGLISTIMCMSSS
jgi:hypothetical protein